MTVSLGAALALAWQQTASAAPAVAETDDGVLEGRHQSAVLADAANSECDAESADFAPVGQVADTEEWSELARGGVADREIPFAAVEESELQWEALDVFEGRTADVVFVFVPASKYGSDPSGLFLKYSGTQELLETREHLVESTNSVDGASVHVETIEEPEVTAQGFSWGSFNDRLASQGISSWTITAIGIACAAAGSATVVACSFGLSIVSSGVVGYCAGQATTLSDPTTREADRTGFRAAT